MKRIVLITALLTATTAFAEEPDATLKALLAEVHQLRVDIEAVTIASQRVQIALYSLQMQDAAVARAAQRVDEARLRCSGTTQNRDRLAAEIQQTETRVLSGAALQVEAEVLKRHIAEQKQELQNANAAVQACQTAESEATTQLRTHQAKLSEIQERIERLEKTLEKLGVNK